MTALHLRATLRRLGRVKARDSSLMRKISIPQNLLGSSPCLITMRSSGDSLANKARQVSEKSTAGAATEWWRRWRPGGATCANASFVAFPSASVIDLFSDTFTQLHAHLKHARIHGLIKLATQSEQRAPRTQAEGRPVRRRDFAASRAIQLHRNQIRGRRGQHRASGAPQGTA